MSNVTVDRLTRAGPRRHRRPRACCSPPADARSWNRRAQARREPRCRRLLRPRGEVGRDPLAPLLALSTPPRRARADSRPGRRSTPSASRRARLRRRRSPSLKKVTPFASSSAFFASMSSTRNATCEAPTLFDASGALVSLGGLLYSRSSRVVSPSQQAHLPESGSRNADGRAQLRALEPRAGLVRELEAEDVVVEADRGVEILHRDPDVMKTLHGSSVMSSRLCSYVGERRLPPRCRRSVSQTRIWPPSTMYICPVM